MLGGAVSIATPMGISQFAIGLILVAVISPVPVASRSLYVDLPVMIAFVVALVPIMLWGMVVTRGEGIFLVTCMFVFLAWQFVTAVYGNQLGLHIP